MKRVRVPIRIPSDDNLKLWHFVLACLLAAFSCGAWATHIEDRLSHLEQSLHDHITQPRPTQ